MSSPTESFFESEVESYARNFEDRRTGTNYLFRRRLDIVRELCCSCRGRLLDCAAGTGEITAAVLQSGEFDNADLVDISANMLTCTARVMASITPCPKLQFIQADIFDYLAEAADAGRSFGLVLCLGLIAHTGRLDELLRSIRRCLTPEFGRLLLQSTLLDHWGTRVVRFLSKHRYERQKGYAISYFRLEDIRVAVQRNGLRVVDERRFGLSIPFGDKIWPAANFRAELATQRWCHRHGAEAILAIERND